LFAFQDSLKAASSLGCRDQPRDQQRVRALSITARKMSTCHPEGSPAAQDGAEGSAVAFLQQTEQMFRAMNGPAFLKTQSHHGFSRSGEIFNEILS
jgi:hypothetical protein